MWGKHKFPNFSDFKIFDFWGSQSHAIVKKSSNDALLALCFPGAKLCQEQECSLQAEAAHLFWFVLS